MIDSQHVLVLSGLLFCVGLCGLISKNSIVKTIMSIEVIILSSVLNFCYFAKIAWMGELISFIAVMLSAVFFAIAFVLISSHYDIGKNDSILEETINNDE